MYWYFPYLSLTVTNAILGRIKPILMSISLSQPEQYNLPCRLTPEQINNPYQVLEDFYCDHSLGDIRKLFSEIGEACLTSNKWPFNDGEKRADLLYYYKKIETLLEAAYVIADTRKGEAYNACNNQPSPKIGRAHV